MAFIDPKSVTSPKTHWKLEEILYSSGQGGWSASRGKWDGSSVVGVRWNGSDEEDGNGNPQSRGYPTWFVVPSELEDALLREVELLSKSGGSVFCKIFQPADYDLGAWRIEASLSPQAAEQLDGCPLIFELPNLPKRFCHADKGYGSPVGKELHGMFVDGSWKGHLYSNGIGEVDNPTGINAVRDAIIQNVLRVLRKQSS